MQQDPLVGRRDPEQFTDFVVRAALDVPQYDDQPLALGEFGQGVGEVRADLRGEQALLGGRPGRREVPPVTGEGIARRRLHKNLHNGPGK